MKSKSQLIEHNQIAQGLEDDEKPMDMVKLLMAVWHRKWSILSLGLIVSLATSLVVLVQTPTYHAAATLLIQQKNTKVVSIEQIYGVDGAGLGFLETQLELLKSRFLAERVVRELDLTHNPLFDPRQQQKTLLDFRGLLGKLDFRTLLHLSSSDGQVAPRQTAVLDATPEQIFDGVTQAFRKGIVVSPQGRSQLVTIEVDMADPLIAARAANALANGFIEDQLEANTRASTSATGWMNNRLGELRIQLKSSEQRLQDYRESENLVDMGGVGTISANELSLTGERMINARSQRAEAESQWRQVQVMGNNWERLASVPAVLGHPLIQQFKAEQARAQAKVDELSRRYGDRHPAMDAARSDLNAANASLRGQVQQVVAGIERNYQLALTNQNSLQSSFNENRTAIQGISRKEFKLRELQREVDDNRALYDTFMNRLKEADAISDLDSANARIVDQAVVPTEPIKPRKSLIVVIAALLSLCAGAGLVIILELLNNTFKSREQVESQLNIPVLGILPLLKSFTRIDMARMFHSDKDKGFSESVRTIRTSIVLAGSEHGRKVLLVTSAIPDEGKSTVAINLAYAFGRLEKVLLIDADLRRPSVAKNFEFAVGTPGLANLIAGTASREECIKVVDGIDVLCAGTVPPNPLELLSSSHFDKTIEDLMSGYDRIIIDSPPTQAVIDAMVLSTYVDAVIYVVKYASTSISLVEKGIGQLLQNNAPVTGIVLSQVDIKKSEKYGYINEGHYYDYSSDIT
ncbi:polysaccharide biosynthesis tyrosine autokinase [Pseudomonas sp. CCC2.2]|uniref:GumC family protein n=1 Tax=Pseudomonas sp. CCC2.2 TaxID=3048605 RepID=UPI002B2281E4|nr:polysaccharide biosynthesis tyrosine autokinase [Pseudomonas sp. CCC2.2]MEB0150088.1 polysaccharide biosynthesis tyrosine autokinase [Pseudomonas sp. CCC2.2]